MSKGNDWIDVKAEVNLIKDYLTIQSLRYSDILRFEIRVDDDIQKYPMLKLTLQPLVENALYHGIKNKRGGGVITVWGYREKDELVFRIEDDGVGMTEKQLAHIAHELYQKPHSVEVTGDGGFGLKNVNSRIKLYYGEQYGLTLRAREGGGMIAEVRLGLESGNV